MPRIGLICQTAASSSSLRASRLRRLASTCDNADLAESWSSRNSPTGWLVSPWFIMVGVGESTVTTSEHASAAREMREPGVTRAGCCDELLPAVPLLLKRFSRLVMVSSRFCIAAWVSVSNWSNGLICISTCICTIWPISSARGCTWTSGSVCTTALAVLVVLTVRTFEFCCDQRFGSEMSASKSEMGVALQLFTTGTAGDWRCCKACNA